VKRGGAQEVKVHIDDAAPTVSDTTHSPQISSHTICYCPSSARPLELMTRRKLSNGPRQRSILQSFATPYIVWRSARADTACTRTHPLYQLPSQIRRALGTSILREAQFEPRRWSIQPTHTLQLFCLNSQVSLPRLKVSATELSKRYLKALTLLCSTSDQTLCPSRRTRSIPSA
jgi:hypothetical protein